MKTLWTDIPVLSPSFCDHPPAIDRRDHEWKPRVRTPTHPNLMTFGEYAQNKGWQ